MSPSLVLFDIDGTLIDSAGAGRRAIERAFVEIWSVDPENPRTNDVEYAGRTDPEIFRALAEAHGVPHGDYLDRRPRLLSAYYEALESEMARPDRRRRVLPGVRPLLDHLNGLDGVHVGLLTGNMERGARIKLSAFDLVGQFSGGGFGSDHEDRDRIAWHARRRLSRRAGVDFAPSRVVVVGDTPHDVACARANGFRSLAVATGRVRFETLRDCGPDAVFSDLRDRSAVCAALGVG